MNNRAFTLLEMLLALVLSTLLMVAVLAVLADLGGEGSVLDSSANTIDPAKPEQVWQAWADLLTEDLRHSRATALAENSIEFLGQRSLGGPGFAVEHRPVLIRHAIRDIGEHRWVVREEFQLDDQTNQNRRSDLVCRDVGRFELIRHGDEQRTRRVSLDLDSGSIGAVTSTDAAETADGDTKKDRTDGISAADAAQPADAAERQNIRIGSNWYFPEYVPTQYREQYGIKKSEGEKAKSSPAPAEMSDDDAAASQDSPTEANSTKADPDEDTTEDQYGEPTEITEEHPLRITTWRFRVWSVEGELVLDRIVRTERSGG